MKERVQKKSRDILQEDTLLPYILIICLIYVLWTSIDLIRENRFTIKTARRRRYPAKNMTGADKADDLALLANTTAQQNTSSKKHWPRRERK